MRICVISDIHGNAFALEAVLEDIRTRNADVIVNLGDIFYGPLAPRKTYDLLKDYEILTIQGNQDRQIYEATKEDIKENPTMGFVVDELKGEPLTWLRTLPKELTLEGSILLCHGAPGDDMAYFLEDVEDGLPKVRRKEQIQRLIGGTDAPVILCGHTHLPRVVQLSPSTLIVNPGSVGLPAYSDYEPTVHAMETFAPFVSYCLLQSTSRGWQVEHYRIPYDSEAAINCAKKQGRLDWVQYLDSGWAL